MPHTLYPSIRPPIIWAHTDPLVLNQKAFVALQLALLPAVLHAVLLAVLLAVLNAVVHAVLPAPVLTSEANWMLAPLQATASSTWRSVTGRDSVSTLTT